MRKETSQVEDFLRIYTQVLRTAAGRISSLELHAPADRLLDDPTLTQAHVPLDEVHPLDSLTSLQVHRLHAYHGEDDEEEDASFLRPLFGDLQAYPRLTILDCGLVSWKFLHSVLRPYLTVLRVTIMYSAPSWQGWLTVLASTPKLEELSLWSAISGSAVGPDALATSVDLFNLWSISLTPRHNSEYEVQFYDTLLHHLHIPNIIHTHTYISPASGSEVSLPWIASQVQSCTTKPLSSPHG